MWSRRKKFFGGVFVPSVGTFFFEPLQDIAQRGEIVKLFAAAFAEEHDDRNAPEALARDAPVGTLLDHFVDAIFAPGGNPFDVVNFFERFGAKGFGGAVGGLVHFDKPLLGGTKNDGIVAAPAMRIGVLIGVMAEKRAAIGEEL